MRKRRKARTGERREPQLGDARVSAVTDRTLQPTSCPARPTLPAHSPSAPTLLSPLFLFRFKRNQAFVYFVVFLAWSYYFVHWNGGTVMYKDFRYITAPFSSVWFYSAFLFCSNFRIVVPQPHSPFRTYRPPSPSASSAFFLSSRLPPSPFPPLSLAPSSYLWVVVVEAAQISRCYLTFLSLPLSLLACSSTWLLHERSLIFSLHVDFKLGTEWKAGHLRPHSDKNVVIVYYPRSFK